MSNTYYDLVSKDNRFFYNPVFAKFTDRFNKSFRVLFFIFSISVSLLFVLGAFWYKSNLAVLGLVLIVWFIQSFVNYKGKLTAKTVVYIPTTTCLVVQVLWMISHVFDFNKTFELGFLSFSASGNNVLTSYLLSYIVALILILSFVYSLFSMVADQSMSVFDNIGFINREQHTWKKNLYTGLLFVSILLISNFIVFKYFGDWLFPLGLDLMKNIKGIEVLLNLVPLIYYFDTLFNSRKNVPVVSS
jgi:hypothetical protein